MVFLLAVNILNRIAAFVKVSDWAICNRRP
jgi:hypothetical protein